MSAKLDAADLTHGNNALHLACYNGHKEIVELLATERTFDSIFNRENKAGQRPIDIAEEKVIEL